MSGITPAPEGALEIVNYDEFPNNILSKVGGKWNGFNMNIIDEDDSKQLYYGTSKGWMVYALKTAESIDWKWVYKSYDIKTKISNW